MANTRYKGNTLRLTTRRCLYASSPTELHTCKYILCDVKVKLSLCFNWAPLHEGVLGEWRYSSTHYLTSALDGGERSASRPGRFTPRERAPGTHWIGGCVGPRAVLDVVVKRKILSPRRESKSRTPIVQPLVQRYTDWAIAALILCGVRFGTCLLKTAIPKAFQLQFVFKSFRTELITK
jgi:hypothetical protein